MERAFVSLAAVTAVTMFAHVVLMADTDVPAQTSESILLVEFQTCSIVALAAYYSFSLLSLGMEHSDTLAFARARIFETVLIPALSVLLFSAEMEGATGNWLPAVQANETELVRLRLPIFVMFVTIETLTTYHQSQSSLADLVAIVLLTVAFAVALSFKYDSPIDDSLVSAATFMLAPSAIGLLVYLVVKGLLWDVPSGNATAGATISTPGSTSPSTSSSSSHTPSATAGRGTSAKKARGHSAKKSTKNSDSVTDDVDLFSDGDDNANGGGEHEHEDGDGPAEDDEALAKRLQMEEIPRELWTDGGAGQRSSTSPIQPKRLRQRAGQTGTGYYKY